MLFSVLIAQLLWLGHSNLEKHIIQLASESIQTTGMETPRDWNTAYESFQGQYAVPLTGLKYGSLAFALLGCWAAWRWWRLRNALHRKPVLLFAAGVYPGESPASRLRRNTSKV